MPSATTKHAIQMEEEGQTHSRPRRESVSQDRRFRPAICQGERPAQRVEGLRRPAKFVQASLHSRIPTEVITQCPGGAKHAGKSRLVGPKSLDTRIEQHRRV